MCVYTLTSCCNGIVIYSIMRLVIISYKSIIRFGKVLTKKLTTQHIFTSDINSVVEVEDKVEDKKPPIHNITLERDVMTTRVTEYSQGSIEYNISEYKRGDIRFKYDDDDQVKQLIWDKIKSILQTDIALISKSVSI